MMGKEDSKIVRPAVTIAFKETRDIAADTCQYMAHNANLSIMIGE